MLNKTSLEIQKEGGEAFLPGADPMNHQPYSLTLWKHKKYFKYWLDGWEEAENKYWSKEENYSQIKIEVTTSFFRWWKTLPCNNNKNLMYVAWQAWQASKKHLQNKGE